MATQRENLFEDAPVNPDQRAFLDQLGRVEDIARTFLTESTKLREMGSKITLRLDPDADLKPAKKVHVQKALLTTFDLLHQQKFKDPHTGDPIPAHIDGAKDAAIITRLLKQYTPDKLEEMMPQFFDLDDDFTQRAGYTVGVFSTKLAGLIARNCSPIRTQGLSSHTVENRRQSEIAVGLIHRTAAASATRSR